MEEFRAVSKKTGLRTYWVFWCKSGRLEMLTEMSLRGGACGASEGKKNSLGTLGFCNILMKDLATFSSHPKS